MTSLDDTPRVPCASLLVRIMTPGEGRCGTCFLTITTQACAACASKCKEDLNPAAAVGFGPIAEAAKAQRRKPPPLYSDRVYDSVTRCMPTALERKLYGRLLAARQPWSVREAARLVSWYR